MLVVKIPFLQQCLEIPLKCWADLQQQPDMLPSQLTLHATPPSRNKLQLEMADFAPDAATS